MAKRRLHRGWLIVAAVSIAAAPVWLRWIGSTPERQPDDELADLQAAAVLPVPALQLLANQERYEKSEKPAPRGTALPGFASDPVGSAPDLKRVFDDYIDSADPRQRRTAVRAFEACVPAFLPPAGQSPSPEPLIAALPPDHRAEREAAYRSLFARCHRLLDGDRVALAATLQAFESDPQSQAPGLRAQEAALAGRLDRTGPLVSEALNGADAAAVASLAGLAGRVAPLRPPDDSDAVVLRAQEIDAALPRVACDLGMDCSAQSLWALQLCAAEGLCEGDVSARLMARGSRDRVDPGAVQKERLRLLGLLRSGRTLGMADLLPQ